MTNEIDTDRLDQLNKIKQLAELLADRELIIQRITDEIFDLIEPTVLQALFELFEVPGDNIDWLDVQVSGQTLVVAASVTYDAEMPVPPIIDRLSPSNGKTGKSVRLFRAGVPIDIVFSDKKIIIDFIVETVKQMTDNRETTVPPAQNEQHDDVYGSSVEEFDQTGLSKEQLQQMLLFQQQTRKTRH